MPERLEAITAQACSFFAADAGGPGRYDGRAMAQAHRGMNVGVAEYMAAADDIHGTLEELEHDDSARAEMLAILWSLKFGIIGV